MVKKVSPYWQLFGLHEFKKFLKTSQVWSGMFKDAIKSVIIINNKINQVYDNENRICYKNQRVSMKIPGNLLPLAYSKPSAFRNWASAKHCLIILSPFVYLFLFYFIFIFCFSAPADNGFSLIKEKLMVMGSPNLAQGSTLTMSSSRLKKSSS